MLEENPGLFGKGRLQELVGARQERGQVDGRMEKVAHAESDRLHDKIELRFDAQQHDVRVMLMTTNALHQLKHAVFFVPGVADYQIKMFGLKRRREIGLVRYIAIIQTPGCCN